MDLHIMLDETSQSPQDRLHEVLQIIKFMETERGMVAARAWREKGNGELLFNGNKVSVLQDGKSSGDGWC